MWLTFALRHLVRHWRVNSVALAGMLLGTTLLSGLTTYAAVIAGQSLAQSLVDAYPSVRNIKASGDSLTDQVEVQMRSVLGELVQSRIDVYDRTVDARRAVLKANGKERPVPEFLFLRLWAFDPFDEHVEVLSGRLPEGTTDGSPGVPGLLEAAIGEQTAVHADLGLGDELVFADETHRVRIVDIVAALDPRAEMWWGDQNMVAFGYDRRPTITGIDELHLSFLTRPETMKTFVGPEDAYWRVLLNWGDITVDDAVDTRNRLSNLAARLAKSLVKTETGLVGLINDYQAQLALSRVSLLLLTAQSLLAVLYTLSTISAFVLDQSQTELASLAGQGYSRWQITRLFAVQAFVLAFGVALPLGPVLAHLGFRLWGAVTASAVPRSIPNESWWLSAVAATFGWLALTLPLHLATRHNLMDLQNRQARPPQRPRWQRLSIDFLLLALGGLAHWQLVETGSFVRETSQAAGGPISGAAAADPVLLLGPSLLLLAIGMVGLRVFPLLLRLASWLTRTLRGLVLPLGLARLARDPTGDNRVVLLVSLTAGLLLFATVFEDSIAERQEEIAHYRVGADLRILLPLDPEEAKTGSAQMANLPGVLAASPVYLARSQWSAHSVGGVNYMNVTLCAVDPGGLARVADYPSGISSRDLAQVLSDLETTSEDVLLMLLSPDAPPEDAQVGEQVEYMIGQRAYTFEVRGRVEHFPTLDRPFAITSLPALEQQIDLGAVHLDSIGRRELWLDTAPAQHAALIVALQGEWFDAAEIASSGAGRILGDAQAQLRSFRTDLVAQMTTSAFDLNALILAILSCASFVLIQAFAAGRRRTEFSVLRAMGLATHQLVALLALEGISMLLLGLLAGTGIGLGMAYIMRPFLSLTLASSLGSGAIDEIVIHWSAVARLYAGLASVYILALVLLLVGLVRSQIHRTLRMGDE